MDFYLQSHNAIKGTARSAHYVVVQNGMGLAVEQLQNITHSFCYSYAKATKGVSYCAPAFYADRLCDCGRAYLRHWLLGKPGYRASRGRQAHETWEQYCDFVKTEIHSSAYWRPYAQGAAHPPRKYGLVRQNPWDAALDDTMFYL